MSESGAPASGATADLHARDLTFVLGASAALVLGYWIIAALGRQDIGTLESALVLPIARQLTAGPWSLYGPYDGRNVLVLIHGPLYYHAAALLGWPMTRIGLDAVAAALAAGRILSVVGLCATLAAAYRIAREDGAGATAGGWAVLLIVMAPGIGGLSFSVRPDTLGLAFQTIGIALVLQAVGTKRPRPSMVLAAYACFALAVCTKQHFIMSAVLSTLLLMRDARAGIHRPAVVAGGVGVFLIVVLAVYGLEELGTEGRMSRSVFFAAGSVGQIHPGGWLHVATVFAAVIGKGVGFLCLLGAAYLALARGRDTTGKNVLANTCAALIGGTAVLAASLLVFVSTWVGWLVLWGGLILVFFLIPGLASALERSDPGRREGVLWLYVAGELGLLLLLCLASDGAWINYAAEASVLASIVAGRVLARAWNRAICPQARWAGRLAALAVLTSACLELKETAASGMLERAGLARSFDLSMAPRPDLFFLDRPGYNRLYGRMELVYDYWLYPVFESLGLAEPRTLWLRQALADDRMRTVLTLSRSPRIDGVAQTLPELGYRPVGRLGPFLVCQRDLPEGAKAGRLPERTRAAGGPEVSARDSGPK
jgi:hypothetical protein